MVFTALASWKSHGACDVSFGGYATASLDAFDRYALAHFEAWLIATQARFDVGDVRDLHRPEPKIDGHASRY